jgi:hypothetical protein
MTATPVLDVLLVVAEFVALFAATWIAWFAVVALYQVMNRRNTADAPVPPAALHLGQDLGGGPLS